MSGSFDFLSQVCEVLPHIAHKNDALRVKDPATFFEEMAKESVDDRRKDRSEREKVWSDEVGACDLETKEPRKGVREFFVSSKAAGQFRHSTKEP